MMKMNMMMLLWRGKRGLDDNFDSSLWHFPPPPCDITVKTRKILDNNNNHNGSLKVLTMMMMLMLMMMMPQTAAETVRQIKKEFRNIRITWQLSGSTHNPLEMTPKHTTLTHSHTHTHIFSHTRLLNSWHELCMHKKVCHEPSPWKFKGCQRHVLLRAPFPSPLSLSLSLSYSRTSSISFSL